MPHSGRAWSVSPETETVELRDATIRSKDDVALEGSDERRHFSTLEVPSGCPRVHLSGHWPWGDVIGSSRPSHRPPLGARVHQRTSRRCGACTAESEWVALFVDARWQRRKKGLSAAGAQKRARWRSRARRAARLVLLHLACSRAPPLPESRDGEAPFRSGYWHGGQQQQQQQSARPQRQLAPACLTSTAPPPSCCSSTQRCASTLLDLPRRDGVGEAALRASLLRAVLAALLAAARRRAQRARGPLPCIRAVPAGVAG